MATATAPSGFGRPIWNAMKNGNQVHGVGLTPVTVSVLGGSATNSRALFVAPPVADGGYWKLESANIIPLTAIAAHGANIWTFELQVGGDDMGGTALSSTGGLTANASYALDVDGPESTSPKNVFLAAGDVLLLTATGAGSPVDQSANLFVVQLLFRVSPPGR